MTFSNALNFVEVVRFSAKKFKKNTEYVYKVKK